MPGKIELLKLYKTLLRESQKFPAYNFRMYAIRKVQDSFRNNKQLTDANAIATELQEAQRNLQIIRRQAIISEMYKADKLIIENIPK